MGRVCVKRCSRILCGPLPIRPFFEQVGVGCVCLEIIIIGAAYYPTRIINDFPCRVGGNRKNLCVGKIGVGIPAAENGALFAYVIHTWQNCSGSIIFGRVKAFRPSAAVCIKYKFTLGIIGICAYIVNINRFTGVRNFNN